MYMELLGRKRYKFFMVVFFWSLPLAAVHRTCITYLILIFSLKQSPEFHISGQKI